MNFLKNKSSGKVLFIVAAVAIVCLILAGYFDKSEQEVTPLDDLAVLCSKIDGVGRCSVMINYDEGGSVSAVAVVCDGAESLSVREGLYKLISSLYGVGYNRISVLKFSP